MGDLLRYTQEVLSDKGPALLLLVTLVLFMIILLKWDIIQESFMSRKRMKTRHRQVREDIATLISNAVEEAVSKNTLTRSDADHWYKQLRSAGLKDLGYEPSFGKPWYFPSLRISTQTLKEQIKRRLGRKEKPSSETSIDDILQKYKRKPG